MSKTVHTVEQLAIPIANEMTIELVDVEYVKEGRDWFLRLFIDTEHGITIDQCSTFSEKIGEKLDEVDPIPEAYILEVSSPGAERPLKKSADFQKAVGQNIHVKLYEAIHGEKEFEGILLMQTEAEICLQIKVKTTKKEIKIPFQKVAKARLAVVF